MTLHRTLGLITIALLGACTVDKNLLGSTGASSGSETDADATAGADTTAVTDATAVTDTTGDVGSTSTTEPTGGLETTGGPVDGVALCAAQIDKAGCDAVEFPEGGDVTEFCVWMNWTPVLVVGETCTMGAPQGKCVHDFAGSEGCASFESCGKPVAAVWKQEGDTVSLAYAQVCITPPEGSLCNPEFADDPVEPPPECMCTCTPDFLP